MKPRLRRQGGRWTCQSSIGIGVGQTASEAYWVWHRAFLESNAQTAWKVAACLFGM